MYKINNVTRTRSFDIVLVFFVNPFNVGCLLEGDTYLNKPAAGVHFI